MAEDFEHKPITAGSVVVPALVNSLDLPDPGTVGVIVDLVGDRARVMWTTPAGSVTFSDHDVVCLIVVGDRKHTRKLVGRRRCLTD